MREEDSVHCCPASIPPESGPRPSRSTQRRGKINLRIGPSYTLEDRQAYLEVLETRVLPLGIDIFEHLLSHLTWFPKTVNIAPGEKKPLYLSQGPRRRTLGIFAQALEILILAPEAFLGSHRA
jgi:hypothetical protein